jgi:hypothetical protein
LATINDTNLSAHTIDPDLGFQFRARISRTTGSITEYLNRLNWDTTVDYDTYKYPLDEVEFTLSNLVVSPGTTISVSAGDTGPLTEGDIIVQPVVVTSTPFTQTIGYNGDQTFRCMIANASSSPKYSPINFTDTITNAGFSRRIEQIIEG